MSGVLFNFAVHANQTPLLPFYHHPACADALYTRQPQTLVAGQSALKGLYTPQPDAYRSRDCNPVLFIAAVKVSVPKIKKGPP